MTGNDFIKFAEGYLHLLCLEFHLNSPSALARNQSPPCKVRFGLFLPSSQYYCRKHKTAMYSVEEVWSTEAFIHELQAFASAVIIN